MSIEVTKVGERFLIRGYTYPIKEKLKGLGCRWDTKHKCWFTEDISIARSIRDNPPKETVAVDDPVVIARARYKDKLYAVLHRKGEGAKLSFRDGSSVFWAKSGAEIIETYDPPISLADMEGKKDE